METLALAGVALLLLVAASAESWGAEGRDAGGPLSVVPERQRADQTADRPRALPAPPGEGSDLVRIVTSPRQGRHRRFGLDRGPGYKLRIVEPPQGVDCKIVCIRPNLNVDYKIRILGPGGHDVSGAPLTNRRKTIILDPNRRGRRK